MEPTDPFQESLATLRKMGAERVLILEGPTPIEVRAHYGLNASMHWKDQISLHILNDSLKTGETMLLMDAQEGPHSQSASVVMLGLRAVMCVPLWNSKSQVAGVLYADNQRTPGVFCPSAVNAGQSCARKLEQVLFGGPSAPPSPPDLPRREARPTSLASLGLRPAEPSRKAPAPQPVADTACGDGGSPTSLGVTGFFRNLAVMLGAGLPIARCLDILCSHDEDPNLRREVQAIAARVLNGSTLSAAMRQSPGTFSNLELQLVRLGEKTGSLHQILKDLAHYRERSHQTYLKVRTALAYPALILVFCLALLVLGPPYLLQGQFQIIRESGQDIPLLTRLLMPLATPWVPPLLAALLLAGVATLRRAWENRPARLQLTRLALGTRGLGPVLRSLATARYARAVALMYRVGLPLGDALQLAGECSDNLVLEDLSGQAAEKLKEGASLATCLQSTGFFPPPFLHMLKAGEESGRVDSSLAWVARVQEEELESALTCLLGMLEPLLMLGIGIVVALIVLGTALPMVKMLQVL